jgi:hypothetical protein
VSLRGPSDLVSCIGQLLCIVGEMDIEVFRAHVSKLAPSQQELEGREECQHLGKVRFINTIVIN